MYRRTTRRKSKDGSVAHTTSWRTMSDTLRAIEQDLALLEGMQISHFQDAEYRCFRKNEIPNFSRNILKDQDISTPKLVTRLEKAPLEAQAHAHFGKNVEWLYWRRLALIRSLTHPKPRFEIIST